MYVSHQLLTTHQDEMLRKAADRRLANRIKAASRGSSRRPARSPLKLRALRLARPAS